MDTGLTFTIGRVGTNSKGLNLYYIYTRIMSDFIFMIMGQFWKNYNWDSQGAYASVVWDLYGIRAKNHYGSEDDA